MHEDVTIEPSVPSDAPFLTELARVSKAHWGYDAAFLAACAAELTITAAAITRFPTFILRVAATIGGFYMLVPAQDGVVELDYLYLAPTYIGAGFGRLLFAHATQRATELGYHTMMIQGDPHAVAFYERMGASVMGTAPSGSIPGRTLPVLVLSLRA